MRQRGQGGGAIELIWLLACPSSIQTRNATGKSADRSNMRASRLRVSKHVCLLANLGGRWTRNAGGESAYRIKVRALRLGVGPMRLKRTCEVADPSFSHFSSTPKGWASTTSKSRTLHAPTDLNACGSESALSMDPSETQSHLVQVQVHSSSMPKG